MHVWVLLLILPAVLLSGLLLLPSRVANRHVRQLRGLVTFLAALQFVFAVVGTVGKLAGITAEPQWTVLSFSGDAAVALTIRIDNLALLMLVLVSFIGWVICRFSIRYLDGEANQGRYFRWTAIALGSVCLMVASGNLLMFMLAWAMTSTALHKLLLHYGHRPAAQRAAWTKFVISRLGDAALIAAIVLIYAQFKTLDFDRLFNAATALAQPAQESRFLISWAAFLLVFGAVTKSAQVPFHTWLPLTMETPTPVSALMHAGIVNAGGYLIIRTSPLIVLQPWAMTWLVIIGGVTTCGAAVVMTTQTSVKKKLAYSTIAQMGFMLLQCGLGAFTAAMLHILAHSLYKAHAFLSSGSVIDQRIAEANNVARPPLQPARLELVMTALILLGSLAVSCSTLGINPFTKPGGLVLSGILCLALMQWLGQTLRAGRQRLITRAHAVAAVLCLAYVASYAAVDFWIADSLPARTWPALNALLSGVLLASFAAGLWLQSKISSPQRPAWLDAYYVHALNGFYIENHLRRWLGSLAVR